MSDESSNSTGEDRRGKPEAFRARSLSVSLTVKDLDTSLAWYRDVVGFAEEERYERDGRLMGIRLVAGDVRILINQDDGARGWDRVKGEGFSIHYTTAQSVDDLARRIEERGGTLAMEPTDMPWGARVFRLLDPDGFKLSVSSVPEG